MRTEENPSPGAGRPEPWLPKSLLRVGERYFVDRIRSDEWIDVLQVH
jgi:hypothetical protein